jgi:hypothetical protein
MQNRLLILDDKELNQDYSSKKAISLLDEHKKSKIDFYDSPVSLWVEKENGDNIELVQDFSLYRFIFIHYSFNDPILDGGLMQILIDVLSETSKVVLFSGERQEHEIPQEKLFSESESQYSYFEIRRSQYFYNLENFIDSYLTFGQYQIKYLYNPYINPKKDKAYALFEIIKADLEESIHNAIESNSFNELLTLYGYINTSENLSRFLKMTDDEFIETLEDFIETN